MIDQLAWTRNVIGLKGGSGIGNVDLILDAELVSRACLYACDVSGKLAVVASQHRGGLLKQKIDALCARRPKSKRRAVRSQSCAESLLIHAEPAKARTERRAASSPFPA